MQASQRPLQAAGNAFSNIKLVPAAKYGIFRTPVPLTCQIMSLQKTILSLCALIGGALPAFPQASETVRVEHVEATLVGEMTHLQPGTPYRLGLLLRHDENWHTYWKSSATGYPTSIEWELPEGFTVSDISWPTPKVYAFQGLTDYVYEGETLLMVTLTPPDSIDSDSVTLGFTAEWLMCEDICIPASMESTLTLPVNPSPPSPSSAWEGVFIAADRALPAAPGPSYSLSATHTGRTLFLEISGNLPSSIYFFDEQAVIKPTPEQDFRRIDDQTGQLAFELADTEASPPPRLTGVLKAPDGWPDLDGARGMAIDLPLTRADPTASTQSGTFSFAILPLAFLGGLILNLMPCVFPVLGIKIMGFVGQAGSGRAKVVAHGLTFTAGVLLSFWLLAAVLLLIRSGGNQLGWGFQLQSPAFVLALIFLLFGFALNMSGLFEFGQSAVGVGSDLTAKSGYGGSFFSGVLATVVATPCAAPFLAPALGAALTLPPAASFLVFTFIAAGLSTPYLLLSLFPGLIDRLPRPGPWMETFKQVMSFLLYATVAFLLWVIAGQLTDAGGYSVFSLLNVFLSLVLLALGLWIFGRWGAFHRRRPVRIKAAAATALVIGASLMTGFSAVQKQSNTETNFVWQDWEPGKAQSLAEEGKIVYIDFTARWCVTCQTNKATIFSSREVRERFADESVVALKADWTNQDNRISEALAKFGRSAVPFNLVYGPGTDSPQVLPEILTPGVVLDALRQAAP